MFVLLSAEGAQEVEECDWVRDATVDEGLAFECGCKVAGGQYQRLIIDGTGRPYWLVKVLDHAPEIAKLKAKEYVRVPSLLW